MEKVTVLWLGFVLIACLVVSTFAAETMKGTIRGIDKEKGMITFCPEGTTAHMPFAVDKSVNLTNIDKDMKVQIDVETKEGKKTIRDIKVLERKRKAIEGC